VAKAGRTVVLVSHQMNQIRRLCDRVAWVDGGSLRRVGSAGEVLAAYETAMFAAEDATEGTRLGPQGARFLHWSIAGAGEQGRRHILTTTGNFRVAFVVELRRPVRNAEHGIALYNAERQLMWGWAVSHLELQAGIHTLVHEFPALPLRPGSYQWQVNLWDENDQLDSWDCHPEMLIETEQHQHYLDEWNGVLNIRSTFSHSARDEYPVTPIACEPRAVMPE
jgi:hypothetical protein